MPIVHIHGVAVRNQADLNQREAMLARYIADELHHDDVAGDVPILRVFWGDLAAKFAWNLQACPDPATLVHMGGPVALSPNEQAQLLAEFDKELGQLPVNQPVAPVGGGGLILAGPAPAAAPQLRTRLKDLAPSDLSDLAVATILAERHQQLKQETLALLAADDVAHDPATPAQLAAQPNAETELALFQQLISQRYTELEQAQGQAQGGLLLQGPGWFGDLKDRIGEALGRAENATGSALTAVLSRFRPNLTRAAITFFGDVFVYQTNRGTPAKPGAIVTRLLDALRQAKQLQQQRHGEPIVLLSHSMGGQVVYDVLTHFLPNTPDLQDLKIDFWCATASQVGVFEELKIFAESSADFSLETGRQVPLPLPAHLGHWWNVWDPNDYLSFTAKPIFAGIDDEPYRSGMSVLEAHGGYLQQPSFYRKFADKLRTHLPANWFRP
ncbi:hypothetical protein [Fibrella aquatilis]|uniref:Alpha/beta hydrolase n=1 Tax=Fibrella aquatilis TaxID=2817059 RepID=A0A939JZN7_9BACT|nr:hypothetical protein [Fibrella aquatilis]MBO0931136.1 hypothetical protein [Fibrella aquatilis]